MTNQEAIDIIKTAIAEVEWDCPMDYAAALKMAIEALENGWINIRDRLPESGQHVLATCEIHSLYGYKSSMCAKRTTRKSILFRQGDTQEILIVTITARKMMNTI